MGGATGASAWLRDGMRCLGICHQAKPKPKQIKQTPKTKRFFFSIIRFASDEDHPRLPDVMRLASLPDPAAAEIRGLHPPARTSDRNQW